MTTRPAADEADRSRGAQTFRSQGDLHHLVAAIHEARIGEERELRIAVFADERVHAQHVVITEP